MSNSNTLSDVENFIYTNPLSNIHELATIILDILSIFIFMGIIFCRRKRQNKEDDVFIILEDLLKASTFKKNLKRETEKSKTMWGKEVNLEVGAKESPLLLEEYSENYSINSGKGIDLKQSTTTMDFIENEEFDIFSKKEQVVLVDFSSSFCGCQLMPFKFFKYLINTAHNELGDLNDRLVLWIIPIIRFFLMTGIFFVKPLEAIFWSLRCFRFFSVCETLFTTINFFCITFSISYIGFRHELLKLYYEDKTLHKFKAGQLIYFLLKKSLKLTFFQLVLVIALSSIEVHISVMENDLNSQLYYMFSNIFFLLMMNIRHCLKLIPVTSNDYFVKNVQNMEKIDIFVREILPRKEHINLLMNEKRKPVFNNLEEAILRTELYDQIAMNFKAEMETINRQSFQNVVLPRGDKYLYFLVLTIFLIADFTFSVLNSWGSIISRNNCNNNKVLTFMFTIGEVSLKPWLFSQILIKENIFGQEPRKFH